MRSGDNIDRHVDSCSDGVVYGDFFAFDPSTSTWTELTNSTRGALPSARFYMGFAADSLKQEIYLFGGYRIGA